MIMAPATACLVVMSVNPVTLVAPSWPGARREVLPHGHPSIPRQWGCDRRAKKPQAQFGASWGLTSAATIEHSLGIGWRWQAGRGGRDERCATEWAHGKNSGASAGHPGGFQVATFVQQTEQRQAGNHCNESCRAQNKEVRVLLVECVDVRRPGFMRLRGAQPGEHSSEAKITFHAAMV